MQLVITLAVAAPCVGAQNTHCPARVPPWRLPAGSCQAVIFGDPMPSIYDYQVRQINGQDIALSAFKGKVVLIVNTASKCGFTPQFGGLEELHKTYGGKGLVVLDG
jgi:hypothetical protein